MTSALELRASVAQLLADEGRAVTLRKVVPGAYDPATGEASSSTSNDVAGRARIGNYSERMVDGQNVQAGDRRATFQPDDWDNVPEIGNQLVDGSTAYGIINVSKRELGDVISYTLQLRK